MTFAAIIPTRGNRKLFLEWQKQRAYDMGYDFVYVIDHEPASDQVDIYDRVKKGVERAMADNVDYCSVIEDDDFFKLEYLDTIKRRINPETDLFGVNMSLYYHLFSTGWRQMSHPGRSSLFCTTFKTEAFTKLTVVNTGPNIDIFWWKSDSVVRQLINESIAVGIKHGSVFGKVGGNGHHMNYSKYDLNLRMIKGIMDKEAFEFFVSVKETYQKTWQIGQKS